MTKHRGFILWLCFIIAAAVLAGCGSRAVTPMPNTQAVIATGTPAPTASATITVTRTPRPTSTVTATPTIESIWDHYVTNTPMVPAPVSGQDYRLTEWTAEKAETLIKLLKNYPETLPIWMHGYLGSGYYGAFQAAGLAELESSRRFPESELAKSWQWDGAYNQYQAFNKDAASLYASFIAGALNSNETDLATLEQWAAKTISLSLRPYEVTPPPGYQSSTVLHLYPSVKADFTGGFAIWLVQKDGIFSALSLPNGAAVAYGDGDSSVSVLDITGDGINEAFVQNVDYGSFGAHSGDLTIYRLDQVPPRVVAIEPNIPYPDITLWSVREDQAGPITSFNMPAGEGTGTYCSTFRVDWQYQWQKDRLKLIHIVLPTEEETEKDPFCTGILANVLSRYLKEPSVLPLYKNLLNLPYIDVPEDETLQYGGYSFNVERKRLALALFLTSMGDEAGANEQIQLIRASTNPDRKEWRENALAYYAAHKDPQALYQFCLASKACDSFMQFERLYALIPSEQFAESPKILQQMGIASDNSGSYDFDHDGQDEIWLLFDGSNECGRILILALTANGIKGRWGEFQCTSEPDGIEYEQVIEEISIAPKEPLYGLPLYQIMVDGKEVLREPILYWPPDQGDPTYGVWEIQEIINRKQTELLLGQISPDKAQEGIIATQKLLLDPFNASFWEYELQAQMLYLLGLAYELNGQSQQAVETYLELWQTYSASPYAYMAWAKLEPEN